MNYRPCKHAHRQILWQDPSLASEAGLSLRGKKRVCNAHGNERSRGTLRFMVKTWARHKTTETVLNNVWRLAVSSWWRLAVGGGWHLVVLGGCP